MCYLHLHQNINFYLFLYILAGHLHFLLSARYAAVACSSLRPAIVRQGQGKIVSPNYVGRQVIPSIAYPPGSICQWLIQGSTYQVFLPK